MRHDAGVASGEQRRVDDNTPIIIFTPGRSFNIPLRYRRLTIRKYATPRVEPHVTLLLRYAYAKM